MSLVWSCWSLWWEWFFDRIMTDVDGDKIWARLISVVTASRYTIRWSVIELWVVELFWRSRENREFLTNKLWVIDLRFLLRSLRQHHWRQNGFLSALTERECSMFLLLISLSDILCSMFQSWMVTMNRAWIWKSDKDTA